MTGLLQFGRFVRNRAQLDHYAYCIERELGQASCMQLLRASDRPALGLYHTRRSRLQSCRPHKSFLITDNCQLTIEHTYVAYRPT